MRRSLSLVLGVAAAAAALVPGVSAAATPSAVQWRACPEDAAWPGLECSTVQVPLDYRQPNGRKIDIAISRLASQHPAQRRGVLLTNPGGPGQGGLQWAGQLGQGLPQAVRDAYDVIGMDPRGVGHSTPVTCDLTEEQKAQGNLPYANNPGDVVKQAGIAKTVAQQCATSETGYLLQHVTTANAARDLDRIRAALGEPKISYHGVSYGTYLGAVYTQLFPQRTDRIVLDSNLGPGGYDRTAMRLFGRGMADRFPDFAKFAAADNATYGLGATPEEVTAKFFELAARLDRKPVGGVDGSLFRGLTFGILFSDFRMPELAGNWRLLDRGQPLPPAVPASDNASAARLYTLCGDSNWPKSVLRYQVDVEVDRVKYPMLGASGANITPCAFWPAEPVEPPVRITGEGPSNVLLLQNLRDPGTPLAGAQKLRRAFGDRARMVTVDAGGHGSLFAKNKCGDNAVTTFLTTGQRPARDLACAAETG
ncbi:alpha/beta hydrolase [Actinocrispum wychmicini]|uniref:Alpha/beta hydrolase family protein n=1 Tax=Actinocrispum wychmicini TaxID=1213861 RepID=A0A4R2JAG3_9PSEU|nr:alpha/beta hydrolase [Actinocrispum wychmicini]TCO55764.1 alpha/beta hydrolase family protein [Actinocrispum wychmicini]